MNAKQRAVEIYNQHLPLAATDGKAFRKTVMDQLMAESGCSLAAAATHYNNAKKGSAPVEGLGRATVPKGVRKPGSKAKAEDLQDEDDCFSVIELVPNGDGHTVGRCQAYLQQGDASEAFDSRCELWPSCSWVMIKGLGPNHGDTFKITGTELEIKRYPTTLSLPAIDPTLIAEVDPDEERDVFTTGFADLDAVAA